ncbi:hypothetical protein BDR05DRAFT_252598 [Suillus weaverae]|nr:hypothetical protein BDR05DRAFT_252598 [Suillus weaverae]
MARKSDWDRALDDAVKSVSIQPSLSGYLSMGIALCGQMQVQDGMKALDLTFMFSNEDLKIIHFILLIKAIALFNANQHEEAILRIQQLAVVCTNANAVTCHAVQAYLHLQLGSDALDNACYNEAVDHFTAAVNTNPVSFELDVHSIFEDLTVLFGWDLKNLWQTANQKRCSALLRAGRLGEALESYRYMMDMSDEITKASCLDWSAAFKQECSALHSTNEDAALASSSYNEAIELYSAAIDPNSASDFNFANCSKVPLEKMLREDALVDAQKVIDLNPSSDLRHQLNYATLHGAQRYDEANEAVQNMPSKSGNTPDIQIRRKPRIRHGSACSTISQQLRQQYVIPPEAESTIRKAIHAQLDNAPLRLLHTSTGRLCDREAQIIAFRSSTEYKELLSLTTKHGNLRKECIEEVVVMYFRRVMLSHRWEGKEPLLHDIQDKVVYKLKPVAGIVKLRSFCEIARDAGYHWAWIDTCCIDKHNNAELQESLNSMFIWYRHSALTIVYLSDVVPLSKPGALARSAWNQRGWTVPEFLASEVVLFYQQDWTLYLDDRSPNHKESTAIMQELEDVTGINPQALVAFRPGMRGAREKLQWASTRVTTLQEDSAYSLFGLFDVHLRVNYGEKKQNALGRLLQEIVAQSGDITVLDWVGKPSEFNSCLPADITSYEAPPFTLSSLSEDQMQKSVSSLRHAVSVELASRLYQKLDQLSAPRFAHRRLHLPCIAFLITEVKRRLGQDQATYFTYEVKSDGLHDLQITTEDRLIQFSRARPTRQTFLLVRPWDRCLELPDFADDTQSMEDWSAPESPSHESPGGSPKEKDHVDSEAHSRALRLIVRLGQPFGAFLLAQQRGGEYKRIASECDIIAQVRDMASVDNMMDVRTLEIL